MDESLGFQFPGTFELSAMGLADTHLERELPKALQDAGIDVVSEEINWRHSSSGKFVSVRLAFRAESREDRLIGVVMGDTSENQRAVDVQALLNWGFRFYETHVLYTANKSLATPKVWKGAGDSVAVGVAQPLLVSTPRGKYDHLKATMDLPKSLVAPIAKGQKLGMVKVTLDGKLVAQSPLLALNSVEQGGFFKRLWHELLMWWQSV